jgi:hypothetical protein
MKLPTSWPENVTLPVVATLKRSHSTLSGKFPKLTNVAVLELVGFTNMHAVVEVDGQSAALVTTTPLPEATLSPRCANAGNTKDAFNARKMVKRRKDFIKTPRTWAGETTYTQ